MGSTLWAGRGAGHLHSRLQPAGAEEAVAAEVEARSPAWRPVRAGAVVAEAAAGVEQPAVRAECMRGLEQRPGALAPPVM